MAQVLHSRMTTACASGFAILAALHTTIGISAPVPAVEKTWFFGTGLALVVFALFYRDAHRKLFNQGIASTGWLLANLLLIGFALFAEFVGKEPSSPVILGMSVLSLWAGYAAQRITLVRHVAQPCCQRIRAVYFY